MITFKEVVLEKERETQISFLKQHHLDYEFDIDYSVLVYDDNQLVGTGSLAKNIMKCLLVDPNYQGQNLLTQIYRHLVQKLAERGINHYFVYTLPHNEIIFQSLGMTTVVKTMNSVLIEGGAHILDILKQLKEQYNVSDKPKACVIINANPMTLGHLHLIENAASKNEELIVFVVSEDLSSFPFAARFSIIKKATAHLANVNVLPTLSYLVSRITFPSYFLKEEQLIKDEQTLIDVLVYKKYFVPLFNIKKRYVGEEPYSFTTAKYNKVLKDHLGNHLEIIPRKEKGGLPISASTVRKLIKAGKMEKVKELVPQATYDFLSSAQGEEIVKYIQNRPLTRH